MTSRLNVFDAYAYSLRKAKKTSIFVINTLLERPIKSIKFASLAAVDYMVCVIRLLPCP